MYDVFFVARPAPLLSGQPHGHCFPFDGRRVKDSSLYVQIHVISSTFVLDAHIRSNTRPSWLKSSRSRPPLPEKEKTARHTHLAREAAVL